LWTRGDLARRGIASLEGLEQAARQDRLKNVRGLGAALQSKIHAKIVEANLLAADIPIRLAEIRLRMTWTMTQRHEHLPRP
jgi:DNA polymerase/3'-5' exonuclease PolX